MKRKFLLIILSIVFGCTLSFPQWSYSDFGGNTPTSFAVDSTGEKMYVSYWYGGYFLSHSHGESWTPINSLITSSELVQPDFIRTTGPGNSVITAKYTGFDPFESRLIIKYSTHNGWVWQNSNIDDYWPDSSIGFLDFQMLVAPDDENLWYCWNSTGFGHSFDGGDTWQVVDMSNLTSSTSNCFLDPENSSIIYLTCLRKTLRSNNYGETWEILDELVGSEYENMRMKHLVKMDNDDLIVCTEIRVDQDNNEWTCFRKSEDDGETWNWMEINGLPMEYGASEMFAISDVPGLLYTHGYGFTGFYRSTDYGETWERVTGLVDYPHISEVPFYDKFNNKLYYLANGYGIYVSEDYGYFWEQINTPDLGAAAIISGSMVANPNGFCFSGEGYRFWETSGSGTTFNEYLFERHPDTLRYIMPCELESNELDIRLMVGENIESGDAVNHLLISEDAGNSWIKRDINIYDDPPFLNEIKAVKIDDILNLITFTNMDTCYFVSSDTGRTWSRISLNFSFALLEVYDNFFITINLSDDVFYVSEDYGQSWENWGNPDPSMRMAYDWTIKYEDKLFVRHNGYCFVKEGSDSPWERRGIVLNGATVQEARNYSWDLVTTSIDTFLVAGSIYAAGIFVSEDWGYNWERHDLEMDWATQSKAVKKVVYDKYRDRLWIDTGAGLAYLNGPSLSVDGPLELIPATYETLHTYPNPFNSSTKITFTLDQPGKVTVEVYDILGRKVADLYNDYATIGSHTVIFDGDGLATGSYFVHFIQDGNTTTRKISLIK